MSSFERMRRELQNQKLKTADLSEDKNKAISIHTKETKKENIEPKKPQEIVVKETPKPKLDVKLENVRLGETTSVKGVDRRLLSVVRSMFPYATNNQDAINAFIAVFSNDNLQGLSKDVKDLVKNYQKTDNTISIKENVEKINSKINDLSEILEGVILSSIYTVYDRLGFRKQSVLKLDDINFIDKDVLKISEKLKEQTKSAIDYKKRFEGRPFK